MLYLLSGILFLQIYDWTFLHNKNSVSVELNKDLSGLQIFEISSKLS